MEKYEVTAPPQVMWGVDDQIRLQLQGVETTLEKSFAEKEKIIKYVEYLIERVREMIFKEENIMFPMLVEKLTEEEWQMIAEESYGFGFLIKEVPEWKPAKQRVAAAKEVKENVLETGIIQLPTGSFKVNELKCFLNTLPFDMTFVNKDDVVQYFSEGKERIFARARTVIGRNVSNYHPPASVHIVEQIVEDFKSGKKENEDFWIQMDDKYVLIRYFAVRDEQNEYLGVLEVTQNIAPIKALTGEKRLVSE